VDFSEFIVKFAGLIEAILQKQWCYLTSPFQFLTEKRMPASVPLTEVTSKGMFYLKRQKYLDMHAHLVAMEALL
jgi:hypothetical protein